VLLLLGAFFLVLAGVATFWGAGKAQNTPLNTDTYTYLAGTGDVLDASLGTLTTEPVVYNQHTQVDPDKSTDDVIVFKTVSCLMVDTGDNPFCRDGSDPNLIDASVEMAATDRHTGLLVSDQAKYVGDDNAMEGAEGLYNKFPFDTQKKTYQIYDDLIHQAVDAVYSGTSTLDGVTVYEFDENIPTTDAEIVSGVQGTYSNQTQIWVEPKTGAIQSEHVVQDRKMPDGTTALHLDITVTDATVKANTDDAKKNITQLKLVGVYLPIGGLILGIVCLVVGFWLQRKPSKPSEPKTPRRDATPVA